MHNSTVLRSEEVFPKAHVLKLGPQLMVLLQGGGLFKRWGKLEVFQSHERMRG
jgi:hypothetical protein